MLEEEFIVEGVGWSDGGLFLSPEPKSGERSTSLSRIVPVTKSGPG